MAGWAYSYGLKLQAQFITFDSYYFQINPGNLKNLKTELIIRRIGMSRASFIF